MGNKSHSVHSFLYVDYGVKRKELEDHLAQTDSILGYHHVGQIEWQERDVIPRLSSVAATPLCGTVMSG